MFTGCDHTESPFRLGGKWTAKIVRCLEDGPRRFSELAVPLRGITPKVLTETLRSMERDGLITRTVGDGIPPRVDYALSSLGRTLLAPMAACCTWAAKHAAELERARETYEGQASAVPPAGVVLR
ncbi:winged helix-turn-helix transcriptional regulator [Streptomyces sp. NPDC058369]|uniref:winged helix-turn-helix transcriptional regulator n=1 Tax=Streptomyces sp. NPDC058369 TaxID=3346462 RepID=UPI00365D7649